MAQVPPSQGQPQPYTSQQAPFGSVVYSSGHPSMSGHPQSVPHGSAQYPSGGQLVMMQVPPGPVPMPVHQVNPAFANQQPPMGGHTQFIQGASGFAPVGTAYGPGSGAVAYQQRSTGRHSQPQPQQRQQRQQQQPQPQQRKQRKQQPQPQPQQRKQRQQQQPQPQQRQQRQQRQQKQQQQQWQQWRQRQRQQRQQRQQQQRQQRQQEEEKQQQKQKRYVAVPPGMTRESMRPAYTKQAEGFNQEWSFRDSFGNKRSNCCLIS